MESVCHGEILAAKTRAGGGASRAGAELEISRPDAPPLKCYLSYDIQRRDDPERASYFLRETSALSAFQATGVRVPKLLGFNKDHRAILTEWSPGDFMFSRMSDPEQKRSVAFDYMQQLALIHNTDPAGLRLDGFPEVKPVREYLLASINAMEAKHRRGHLDPLIIFILGWLRRNIPNYDGKPVIVHGDAGPANFLFQDGKVTAVLDWELTHFGDPMEDFAWICFRELISPFYPLTECFAEYERAGGTPVDIDRIRYYRVYIQMTIIVGMFQTLKQMTGKYSAVLGNLLTYYTLHIRSNVEGLAELMGVHLEPVNLPITAQTHESRYYDIALDDLKEFVVPALTDEAASQRAKGIARVIKYWQSEQQMSAAFQEMELDELADVLGTRPNSIADGRAQLTEKIIAQGLDDDTVIKLLHTRVVRETEIMRSAMGALADRHYSPLE